MADIEKNKLPEEKNSEQAKDSGNKADKGEVKKASAKKPDEKDAKKAEKKNKPPIKERIAKFFRDYRSELKKISWCHPNNIVKYTGLVLACIVVVATFLGVLDFSFSKLMMLLGGLY